MYMKIICPVCYNNEPRRKTCRKCEGRGKIWFMHIHSYDSQYNPIIMFKETDNDNSVG
jgi:hypothetical protein